MTDQVFDTLQYIYSHILVLTAIVFLGVGIYIKIVNFMKKSKEEQVNILKAKAEPLLDMIRASLRSLVVEAEKEYGEKTGSIKHSSVFYKLVTMFPSLTELILNDIITKETVDECIELAVDAFNKDRKDNPALEHIVTEESKDNT